MKKQIYCVACAHDVDARLTNGKELYPHRPDLFSFPFWRCDVCKNSVGCHHKTKNPTSPLGCIPTPELKNARSRIHALIDPIWQSGKMKRKDLYIAISKAVGWNYHTAKTKSIEEARAAYRAAQDIVKTI